MGSILDSAKSLIPEVHFYIMWFSVLSAITCLLSIKTRSFMNATPIKLLAFALMLFAGFSWVHDVSAMQNTADFSATSSEIVLLQKKHEYSELQRDVYIEFLEIFSLLVILILPRSHQCYMQAIHAYERKIKHS